MGLFSTLEWSYAYPLPLIEVVAPGDGVPGASMRLWEGRCVPPHPIIYRPGRWGPRGLAALFPFDIAMALGPPMRLREGGCVPPSQYFRLAMGDGVRKASTEARGGGLHAPLPIIMIVHRGRGPGASKRLRRWLRGPPPL